MKFIRIFWGDLEVFDSKFKTQIAESSKHIQDNEIVMVWGKDNEEYLKSLGYETFLIDTNPWREEYGVGHHMFNHTSLLHKLYALRRVRGAPSPASLRGLWRSGRGRTRSPARRRRRESRAGPR